MKDVLNMKKFSISEIMKAVMKKNRILYLGMGFLLVSISMFIINNFIRLPSLPSVSGLPLIPNGMASSGGAGGDRRIFINNY
jgi:hypothetical protein